MSEIEIFKGEAELPYLLDRVEGSDEILVGFPGYRTGVADPALWQRDPQSKYKVNRLLLGSDAHTYWGPAQECRGLRTAAQLLDQVATELDVAPARVACIGTSNAAVLATLTGLAYGAGVLVLGAPPLAMGTLLGNWATEERRSGGKPMTSAVRLLALAEREDGPDAVEWLNDLIPSLAAECPHPCRIRIFTSPDDFVFPGIHDFFEQQSAWPNVEVELDLSDAPSHDAVAKEFYTEFLVRALYEELVATAGSAA